MDPEQLKRSFATVAAQGDRVGRYFYAHLFVVYPELRDLFPASMSAQRDRLLQALGHIVSHVDRLDDTIGYVEALGRDHRKFGVVTENYAQVGEALIATLAYFLGDDWTPELEANWTTAFGVVAGVMQSAAAAAATVMPAWWDATIVEHDLRGLSTAVITLRLEQPMAYWPGQSVSVHSPRRPRVWRLYSPANAPRADHTMELHVRATPGGQLSPALVFETDVGEQVQLGAPVGAGLHLTPSGNRDVLLLAAGTGLAPLRAIVEQVAIEQRTGGDRRVDLFLGARSREDFYDLPMLDKFAAEYPWLTVVPVVGQSSDPATEAARRAQWHNHEVFVCGPPAMVAGTLETLADAGVPLQSIHHEQLSADNFYPLSAVGAAIPR